MTQISDPSFEADAAKYLRAAAQRQIADAIINKIHLAGPKGQLPA